MNHHLSSRQTTLVTTFSLIGMLIPVSRAQVVYSEDFSGGTPGQSLSAPPFNWSMYTGDLVIGSSLHGWGGNSIIGSLGPAGQQGAGWVDFASPSNELLHLSSELYVYNEPNGNDMGLGNIGNPYLSTSTLIWLGHGGAGWELDFHLPGQADTTAWNASGTRFGNETARVDLYANELTGAYWCTLTDQAGSLSSPVFNLGGPAQLGSVWVESDRRYGPDGMDVRNIKVEATPSSTPEPCTSALALSSLAVYLRRRKRRTGPKR